MAWRKLYDKILNPDGPGYVVGSSAEGGRVRITVEEEVSECCEERQGQALDTLARQFEEAARTISTCMPTATEFAAVLRSSAGECCEKWRGRLTYNYEPGAPGAWTTNNPPTFCPECGRRL